MLFPYAFVMTITPKHYNKEHLDNVLLICHVFKDFFQK